MSLLFLEKRPSASFFEMLVGAEKYARDEEGYDAHTHQVIPPSVVTSGAHAPTAALVELLLAPLSASSLDT